MLPPLPWQATKYRTVNGLRPQDITRFRLTALKALSPSIHTIFFEAKPTKRPAAEVPTLTRRDPDPPLRERHPVRLFPPYGALVWPLSLCAVVGELFPDPAWLALSFLLVRWCPPFS